jgi:hypothetical protein
MACKDIDEDKIKKHKQYQKEYQKKYRLLESSKLKRKEYENSNKRRLYKKEYENSNKRKQAKQKYEKSESRIKYNYSPKRKEMQKRYKQTEEYRIRNKEYLKQWRASKHGREVYLKWKTTLNGRTVLRKKYFNKRANKNNIIESFTIDEWKNKLEATKGVCACIHGICLNGNPKVGTDNLSTDHIYPVKKASEDFKRTGIKRIYTINDIQFLCNKCNASKCDRLLENIKPKDLNTSVYINN